MADKDLEKELFDTVYHWGKVGVIVNENAPTFQKLINAIRIDEANKARTLVWGIGYDNDKTALMLRDKLWERIDYLATINTETDKKRLPNEI